MCEHVKEGRQPEPYVINVNKAALCNKYFRKEVWTGSYLQMTLMSIPVCDDIGWEKHHDTDQFIRIEQGNALLQTGEGRGCMQCEKKLCQNDGTFIPAGTWHNIINTGRCPLKVSSIYAPPHHKRGTVQAGKAEA